MSIDLSTPLNETELTELDEFLLSEPATRTSSRSTRHTVFSPRLP